VVRARDDFDGNSIRITVSPESRSDLENLIAKPDKEMGLGVLWVIDKRGARFILEYRKDWKVPIADDAIQITFCPYCGSKLQLET